MTAPAADETVDDDDFTFDGVSKVAPHLIQWIR
jgi:hypothetical protein